MPDTMILPDLGKPASYYAILTHTHKPITPWYTGHQFPDWKFGQGFSNRSRYGKTNKMFTHIQMTDQCIVIQTDVTSIVSSLPGFLTLSANHGQKNFPGMRALIRPNRQSQQWNYRQMVWTEKKQTVSRPKYYYYSGCSWSKAHIPFLTH